MKKTVRFLAKVLALLLAILLLVTFWPNIVSQLRSWVFPPEAIVLETDQLSHELQEMGILVTRQYADEGTFTASMPAIIIGEAQRVTVPYRYQIDFGVDLEQADIHAVDDGLLLVTLPAASMIHDSLEVTGEIEVYDFFYPLTEARYQEILDEQHRTLRQAYLDDETHALGALETAKEKVGALLASLLKAQGADAIWSITFADLPAD